MDEQCDARVQRLGTPRECAIFERNARDRTREDLALQARRRWVELTAEEHVGAEDDRDPLRRELWEGLSAAEFVLGRAATRVRQGIRRRGLVGAVDQLVCKGDLAAELADLDDAGLLAFAWEHVVLRHPEAFSEAAGRAARAHVDEYELHRAEPEPGDAE